MIASALTPRRRTGGAFGLVRYQIAQQPVDPVRELLAVGRSHLAVDLVALHREHLAETDREIVFETLEEAARTPADPAVGPPIQSWDVARLLDFLESEQIEIGLSVEMRNSRGVTSRSPTEGGDQERRLAGDLRADATALGVRWPRIAAVLNDVAGSYEVTATQVQTMTGRASRFT